MGQHLLNFKQEFKHIVIDGLKNTTIRKPRIRPIEVDDFVRLYSGLRTKSTEFLGQSEVIKKIDIKITKERELIPLSERTFITNIGCPLTKDEVRQLAQRDGFKDVNSFFNFFESTNALDITLNLFFFRPLVKNPGFKEVILWRKNL